MESVPIFPPPPAYSILFARNETEKTSPEQDTAQLPLAPPEPIQGQHVIFGELQEVCMTVDDEGTEQSTSVDRDNLEFRS